MEKMLIVVFPSENQAQEGLDALKELHKNKNITLYASAVVVRELSGEARVAQEVDQGPVGTSLGMLTGGLIGLLGGPAGVAVGAAAGGSLGLVFDMTDSGISVDFLDDVKDAMIPGTAAVIADIDEAWELPVDSRLGEDLGGIVFRRLRSDVEEDQLQQLANYYSDGLEELDKEMTEMEEKDQAKAQKQAEAIKKKLEKTKVQISDHAAKTKKEADAKISALQEQIKGADKAQKAKIQKRVTEIQDRHERRKAKLKEAQAKISEAMKI